MRCIDGDSAIFSLQKNGENILTIEINPNNKTIKQVLGSCNRFPKQEEMEIVKKWELAVLNKN